MKIALIGGAGFIGTNLAIHLSKTDEVTVIDRG
jgi:nucleoside-diphosphate-sugar epimerase